VFSTTFILGWIIQKTSALCKVDKKNIISLVLQGTLKNQGIAGGLAIALFAKEAALPSAIYSIFMIVYIMWLDWRK
jgi:BASS family bile acid:Na+ symporter